MLAEERNKPKQNLWRIKSVNYQQWDVYEIANSVDNELTNSEKIEVLTKLWAPLTDFVIALYVLNHVFSYIHFMYVKLYTYILYSLL